MKPETTDVLFCRAGWAITSGPVGRHQDVQRLWKDPAGSLVLDRLPDGYALDFPGTGRFHVNTAARTLCFLPAGEAPDAVTLQHVLIDQVLPRLLAHDGRLVLHAGAATHAGGSIAFIGQSGRGKSTLTASLVRHGFRLLSDDALIADVGPAVTVAAVFPGLRLMPDSLRTLYPESIATTPMAAYSRKRRLFLDVPAADGPDPLDLMIFLDPPPSGNEIVLRPVTGAEACMRLIANSFALDPTDRPAAAARMRKASALTAAVPAFALCYPRRYACLPTVTQAILHRLEARRASPQDSRRMGSDR